MNTNIKDIKNQASDFINEVVENGKSELSDFQHSSKKAIRQASSSTRKTSRYLEDEAQDGLDAMIAYAKAKPVQSVAIALVASWVLKRLMR